MSDYFATTGWTLVLSAGRNSSVRSDQALNDPAQVADELQSLQAALTSP